MNINNVSEVKKEHISTLEFTKGQRKAYDTLIKFINEPYDASNFKMALCGAAGTGKTFLVKTLIKNCNLSFSQIGIAAPTHKACRILSESISLPNININTIQSDLGLRPNYDIDNFDENNIQFDPRGRIKIDDYALYIIDESSMLPSNLCKYLEKLCKGNKSKLLYIGDSYQLPPVREIASSAFKGIKLNELTEIVRQGEDNPVSYLCDLLRYDIKNKSNTFIQYISRVREKVNDINTKGFYVCDNITFTNYINTYFNDEQITKNVDFCKVISYTNDNVAYWNNIIRNSIIKDSNKSIITKNDLLLSYTTIVNDYNECIFKNSEEYIINDIVNYTHPRYGLKGFLINFQAIFGGKITDPLFVLDSTDNFNLIQYTNILGSLLSAAKSADRVTRVSKWKEYFQFTESCLLLNNLYNSQRQLIKKRDIDYGFALTAHKAQGSTFDTVFVDVNNIIYDKLGNVRSDIEFVNRLLYVACSRCKNKLYLNF